MGSDEESRKEALRKKGQEFLEKAISQASTKVSVPKSSSLSDVKISARDSNAHAPLDPALETVGVVVEGLRYYIAALVFVIASAASLVLAKVWGCIIIIGDRLLHKTTSHHHYMQAAMTYIHAPATAVFLHMLTASVVLLVLSAIGEFSLGPFTVAALTQCLPEVVCAGTQVCVVGKRMLMKVLMKVNADALGWHVSLTHTLTHTPPQMLCLFGLLYRESVYLVAVWVTIAPQVLQVLSTSAASGKRPRALLMLLMVIGGVIAGMGCVYGDIWWMYIVCVCVCEIQSRNTEQ